MLAYRALALDPPDDSPGSGPDIRGLGGRAPHPLVRSIAPALDTAFGLESAALLPEAITALIAQIEAGPLGGGARTGRLEFA